MIQIEHDTGDLKREARDLVKANYDAPEPAATGPSLARLREIAKLSPAAVVGATNGDILRFSIGLVTHALTTNPKTGKRSPLGIGIETRLMEVLTSLTGDNPSAALRLAADSATYAYLDHWLSKNAAAMARSHDEPIHPALERLQTFNPAAISPSTRNRGRDSGPDPAEAVRNGDLRSRLLRGSIMTTHHCDRCKSTITGNC